MTKIKSIVARQIFDSRGNPTVETDVITTNNVIGRAAVPSGASTGEHESVELRDELDSYMGKSVFNAVKNVNELISKELNNLSIFDQELIDEKMINLDGTNNKSKLGANAILSVSLAVSKAAANEKNISLYKYLGTSVSNVLPVPLMNIINGGSHSDSPISFQEFMIVPIGAKSFTNALQIGNEVFHNLKSILKSRGLSTAVGDEGGFAPELKGTEDAINTIIEAVNKARTAGFGAIISHRSGETEDTTIADLSVAMGMGQIKTGSASRTDRVCKYNQLLRIEELLAGEATFANMNYLGHVKNE